MHQCTNFRLGLFLANLILNKRKNPTTNAIAAGVRIHQGSGELTNIRTIPAKSTKDAREPPKAEQAEYGVSDKRDGPLHFADI